MSTKPTPDELLVAIHRHCLECSGGCYQRMGRQGTNSLGETGKESEVCMSAKLYHFCAGASPESFDAWLKQYPPDVVEEAGLSLMYLIWSMKKEDI